MLPKLKITYELLLNDMLQKLGMAIAFDPDQADFTGVCKKETLYISRVKHKTFWQLDEEGTEAAAVTAVELNTTFAGGPKGFIMNIDHPFILVIHDHHSKTIISIGIINQPAWN